MLQKILDAIFGSTPEPKPQPKAPLLPTLPSPTTASLYETLVAEQEAKEKAQAEYEEARRNKHRARLAPLKRELAAFVEYHNSRRPIKLTLIEKQDHECSTQRIDGYSEFAIDIGRDYRIRFENRNVDGPEPSFAVYFQSPYASRKLKGKFGTDDRIHAASQTEAVQAFVQYLVKHKI